MTIARKTIARKKEIATILETARMELEKLVTLANLEEETYDNAKESKQEKMDEDEDSTWLRYTVDEIDEALGAVESILDYLND